MHPLVFVFAAASIAFRNGRLRCRCCVARLTPLLVCRFALLCRQANGHIAVAKVLRGRLGFVQGQALRARLAREKSGGGSGGGSGGVGGGDGSGAAPSSDGPLEKSVAP